MLQLFWPCFIFSNLKDDEQCIWLSLIEVLTYSSAHNYFKITTTFGINLDKFFDKSISQKSMIFITPGSTQPTGIPVHFSYSLVIAIY